MIKTVTFIKTGSVFLSAEEAQEQWRQDNIDDTAESGKKIRTTLASRTAARKNGDIVETLILTENKDGYIASLSMTEEYAASMKEEDRIIRQGGQLAKDTGWTITRVQKIDGVVTKTW